jgi:ferredoxin-NADP reductase
LVLRLHIAPNPPILRNYSISSVPGAKAYRVSVKRELHGKASLFLHDHVGVGDVLEVSAPRGTFTLQPGEGPVVLVSAGIGATPVLAMLHSLAENNSPREIWWLHGAHNRTQHPFAAEVRESLKALGRAKSHILYSKPDPSDQPGLD